MIKFSEVAKLPLAFCQVREDARLDKSIIDSLSRSAKVLMVASGGDTLALLAAQKNVESIVAVDANDAQLSLSRIKLNLLNEHSLKRRNLLGHGRNFHERNFDELVRFSEFLGIDLEDLAPKKLIQQRGLDFCGRYECLFAALQKDLLGDVDFLNLLKIEDLRERYLYSSAVWAEDTLHSIFEKYFSLQLLIELFGKQATQNPLKTFSAHFLEQTMAYLHSTEDISTPFLQQFLRGEFSSGSAYDWMSLPVIQEYAQVEFQHGLMLDYMKTADSESFDFIHLSNILDWLSADEAGELLQESQRLLKKGGRVFIRQLNSSLDIEATGGELSWDGELADVLLAQDRSFFYRKLFVGCK